MSDEERLHLYDEVVNVIFNNLVHACYRNHGIMFRDFDPKNKEMMCFLHVAITFNWWGREDYSPMIYLEMGFWKFLLFKLKNWKIRKMISRHTSQYLNIYPLEFEEIANHVKNFFNLGDDLLVKVYEEYYEKKN